MKHVPSKARVRWARVLRVALGEVERDATLASVVKLQMMPKCVLCIPPSGRGERQHRGQTLRYTLSRLERWERGDCAALFRDAPRSSRAAAAQRSAEAAAAARAERAEECARDGLWSKATSALLDGGVAEPSAAARAELRGLHPDPFDHLDGCPESGAQPPPDITPACVLKQLRSFPTGTAPGPSGLRAQHLVDALTPGEEGALAERLAPLVNWLAAGSAPAPAAPHLGGARLIALLKPNGSLRPSSGRLPSVRCCAA